MYRVVEINDNKVTLERPDGTQFTIVKAEYFLNYIEKSS